MTGSHTDPDPNNALEGDARGRSLPPFAAMRAFEAVGRVGGVRRAAAALSLDHAVVSRHLRLLEEWLGVPLFRREGGQLIFTPAGAGYHERVSAALADLVSATRAIVDRAETRRLCVWCVPGLGFHWVSEQIADFQTSVPDCDVELRPTDNGPDFTMLEADVDIRFYGDAWSGEPGGRGLRAATVARPLSYPVASPQIAARVNAAISAKSLLDELLIHEENQEEWHAWFAGNGINVPLVLPGPMLWHAHLALAAARRGRGIALANDLVASRYLADGTLVKIEFADAKAICLGSYVLVARGDRWAGRLLRKFRVHLQQQAEAHLSGRSD